MKILRSSAAITLVILASSLAFAQQPGMKPYPQASEHHGHGNSTLSHIAPPGMWWKNPALIQKLAITADQQKRMDDIFQQSRLKLIDLKADVEKQEVMLEPLLNANPPDTNKVIAQINHVAQSRAALEETVARMLLGIRTVLTPDQWTKLQAEDHASHLPSARGSDHHWQGNRPQNGPPQGRPGTGGNIGPQSQQPPPPPA